MATIDFPPHSKRWFPDAAEGRSRSVLRRLAAGQNPDESISMAYQGPVTALIFAAMYGREHIIRILLDAGCSIDLVDAEGHSAAMHAATRGNTHCLRLLINAGCNLGLANTQGFNFTRGSTALSLAASNGLASCVEELLRAGVDLNHRDERERTAAMGAANARAGFDALRLLVESGCSLDAQDHHGYTAAMIATSFGFEDKLALLIAAGCDLELKNNQSMTAADIAIEGEVRLEKCRILIDAAEISLQTLHTLLRSPPARL